MFISVSGVKYCRKAKKENISPFEKEGREKKGFAFNSEIHIMNDY